MIHPIPSTAQCVEVRHQPWVSQHALKWRPVPLIRPPEHRLRALEALTDLLLVAIDGAVGACHFGGAEHSGNFNETLKVKAVDVRRLHTCHRC
jgi:hypothetical protein